MQSLKHYANDPLDKKNKITSQNNFLYPQLI